MPPAAAREETGVGQSPRQQSWSLSPGASDPGSSFPFVVHCHLSPPRPPCPRAVKLLLQVQERLAAPWPTVGLSRVPWGPGTTQKPFRTSPEDAEITTFGRICFLLLPGAEGRRRSGPRAHWVGSFQSPALWFLHRQGWDSMWHHWGPLVYARVWLLMWPPGIRRRKEGSPSSPRLRGSSGEGGVGFGFGRR